MKAFQVLQNGKPCASYNIRGWGGDTFLTKRAAELFMLCWAYPYSLETARAQEVSFNLGVEYDLGMSDVPVMMAIKEVDVNEEQIYRTFGGE